MSFNLTDLYRESIVEAAQAPRHHGQLKKKNEQLSFIILLVGMF